MSGDYSLDGVCRGPVERKKKGYDDNAFVIVVMIVINRTFTWLIAQNLHLVVHTVQMPDRLHFIQESKSAGHSSSNCVGVILIHQRGPRR